MAILRGGDIVYAVRFEGDTGEEIMRVLYQTGGGRTKTRDEIEVNTKDIDGTDYGAKTEEINFTGYIDIEDTALNQLEKHLDEATFAEILEINKNTLEAKVGMYMVSNLSFDYPDKESAEYTFDGKLVGNTKDETLEEMPKGATNI